MQGTVQSRVDLAASEAPESDLTVLVIDDEHPIRLLLRVNLEWAGMRVLEAPDGSSGLQLALSELPDLILLDVLMGGLNGWDVADRLQDDPRTCTTPLIFLTALEKFPEAVERSGIQGVEILLEPFNPLEVAPLVMDVLSGGRGRLDRGGPRALQRLWSSTLRGERQ